MCLWLTIYRKECSACLCVRASNKQICAQIHTYIHTRSMSLCVCVCVWQTVYGGIWGPGNCVETVLCGSSQSHVMQHWPKTTGVTNTLSRRIRLFSLDITHQNLSTGSHKVCVSQILPAGLPEEWKMWINLPSVLQPVGSRTPEILWSSPPRARCSYSLQAFAAWASSLWRQSANAMRHFPAYRDVMGRSWSF